MRETPARSAHPRRGAEVRAEVSRAAPLLALTVTEAAAALSVSPDFFHEHIAPELRWVRRGRKKLIAVAELERWLERSAALTLNE